MMSANGNAKRIKSIADLAPDQQNANRGTQRGRGLLEKSLRQYGAGRSVLTDRGGNLIAGNKTVEIAAEIDLPIRVVQTDGKELVVVQRTDLELDSKEGRELALADNRVAETNLQWDLDGLQLLADEGVALDEFWNSIELDRMLDTSGLALEDTGAPDNDNSNSKEDVYVSNNAVRLIQLFFDTPTYDNAMALLQRLAKKYGTDNITDTVWRALQDVDDTG